MVLEMKKLSAVLAFLFCVYAALAAYVITSQGIQQLLVCADAGGLKVPYSKQICRAYLFIFRGSKQDIDALEKGAGALFVIQGESTTEEREEILKFLVSKGLDVNRASDMQLSPLHGAVLANSAEEVKLLLDHGANPKVNDDKVGATALEFALRLQSDAKSPSDYDEVIALLREADFARSVSPNQSQKQHAEPVR